MTRTLEMPCRFALVLIVVAAATGILALSAVAQTGGSPARKRTPPPAGSAEKWVGMYAGQDRQGKIVPPGFKVLVTPELRDDEKLVPHEPDVVEVVTPLLQPWALARANATDYELEDAGVICRPTGLLRPNQTSPFELLVSPEKITVFSTGGRGRHQRVRFAQPIHNDTKSAVNVRTFESLSSSCTANRPPPCLCAHRDRNSNCTAFHLSPSWSAGAKGESAE